MTESTSRYLEAAAASVALVAGLAGMFGAFVLLPSRMEAAERQIARLSANDERNRELLVRIEERLIQVQVEVRARKVTQ
jgi:hypothetical protein